VRKPFAIVLAALVVCAFASSTSVYADVPAADPLNAFVASLPSGSAQHVTGVYVSSDFEFKVMQQPPSMPTYISILRNTVTQYSLAAQYGSIGLLAHNYLSGAQFSDLVVGQQVDIVNGDGTVRQFRVSEIHHYKALSPYDPYSQFVDLDAGGAQLSSTDVFHRMYSGNRVVFQTCMYVDGASVGGRLFVIATPI
jgi:hypothetical protein